MFIEWRAHVASLVAVFLALGLGVLIGTNLAGHDQTVIRQQEAAIAALQQELGQARQDAKSDPRIADLQTQLDDERRLSAALLGPVVANRLNGTSVYLIDLGSGQTSRAAHYVTQAGGQVAGTLFLTPEFLAESPQLLKALGPAPDADPHQIIAQVMTRLAQDLFGLPLDRADQDLQVLQQKGVIKIQGALKAGSVAVLLGGPGLTQSGAVDIVPPLATALSVNAIRVVGAQNDGTQPVLISILRELNVPTVDHLDTTAGQLSLTLAMVGANGHWGDLTGDDGLFPPLGEK